MNRIFCWGTLITLCIFQSLCIQASAVDKPNVIIVLGDDIGYEAFGCTGNDFAQTPNIDTLAKEGLLFDRFYTTVAVCCPARTELYTGLYPRNSGVYGNTVRIKRDGVKSMVDILEPLGYQVGLTGKLHFDLGKKFKKIPGFPVKANFSIAEYDLSGVKSFISKAQAKDQPFCAVIASVHAHHPWDVGTPQVDGIERIQVPEQYADTELTRDALVRHAAEVTLFDQQLADVREMMDEMDLAEDTILICLSENGIAMPRGKWSVYEKGNRALCIVSWPGKVKPGRTAALSKYCDILPTLVDYAGGPDPDLDGFSLRPVLEGKSQKHRDSIHLLRANPNLQFALIQDDWKLVWSPDRVTSHLMHVFDETPSQEGIYVKKFAEVWAEWNQLAKTDMSIAETIKRTVMPDELELYRIDRDYNEWTNLAGNPENQARVERMQAQLSEMIAPVIQELGVGGKSRKHSTMLE